MTGLFRRALARGVAEARRAAGRIHRLELDLHPSVRVGDGVRVRGRPLIEVHPEAQVVLGSRVALNSSNRGYHINMHSPVKLVADRPGARILIGDDARIHGSCVHAFKSIVIGARCLIAANCQIIDANGHPLAFQDPGRRVRESDEGKPIVLEDDVWLAANSFVLGGVTIGFGSVIAANSVVASSVPPMVLVAGNPARVIREYSGLDQRPTTTET